MFVLPFGTPVILVDVLAYAFVFRSCFFLVPLLAPRARFCCCYVVLVVVVVGVVYFVFRK